MWGLRGVKTEGGALEPGLEKEQVKPAGCCAEHPCPLGYQGVVLGGRQRLPLP